MRCPTLAELSPHPPDKTVWPWTEASSQLPDTMPNGSPWLRISIVTPSYNQGQFIEETIRSVLLQGYPDVEYIIIDGGSTDESVEIIKKYAPWLAYWVSEPDRGQSHAINKGIEHATGEILLWLNADDLCLPGAFQEVALAFANNPSARIVIGQAQVINAQGEIIGEFQSHFTSWIDLATQPLNLIRQVSTFFSHSLFDELGMVDENLNIAMDTELLIRFTRNNPPLILDQYLTVFRKHENAKSQFQVVAGYEEADRVRLSYLIDNKEKSIIYRGRTASRWLRLSKSDNLSSHERITCLKNAITAKPSLLISRSSASAAKKLCKDWVQGNENKSK